MSLAALKIHCGFCTAIIVSDRWFNDICSYVALIGLTMLWMKLLLLFQLLLILPGLSKQCILFQGPLVGMF